LTFDVTRLRMLSAATTPITIAAVLTGEYNDDMVDEYKGARRMETIRSLVVLRCCVDDVLLQVHKDNIET